LMAESADLPTPFGPGVCINIIVMFLLQLNE
jgi:hypothetical protein